MEKALSFTTVGKEFMDEVRQKVVTSWRRGGDFLEHGAGFGQLLSASLTCRDFLRGSFSHTQALKPYGAALTSGTNPFVIHHQTLNK